MTRLRDVTGEIVLTTNAEAREPTAEELEDFKSAMIDFIFLPGDRAAFTSTDLSGWCHLDATVLDRVLEHFSVPFEGSTTATDLVNNFLHTRSPLGRTGLIRSEGSYLTVSGPIGTDSFRTVVEDSLKNTAAWDRYDRTRCLVSETLAVGALAKALSAPPLATNLKHFAPVKDHGPELLARDCVDPTAVGELVEADSLFVVEDVAVCLEVKARSVAEPARRGDVNRLRSEIKKILGEGARQARRLETLLRTNGGYWDEHRNWVDLSHVREIHTIVAGLDYFGPLGVALGDLAETELLGHGHFPWVVSIHDLETISRVVDRPSELLLYLRRRTGAGVARHFRGADELDVFMLFMEGGLYVPDDPDEIRHKHPTARYPTKTARKRHQDAARPTRVGTFTDPLDAWMYWVEGSSQMEASKPEFNVDTSTAELVDFLAEGPAPGWLRIGADLMSFDGRAQERIMANVAKIVRQTRIDGKSHSLVQALASSDGYTALFAVTVPEHGSAETCSTVLREYMAAKKHQVGADRCLGLLIDHDGDIRATVYMNDLPEKDPEIDELVARSGLKPIRDRPHPVSAKKRQRRAKRGR